MVSDAKVLSALAVGSDISLQAKYEEIYKSREVWLRKTFMGKHSLIAHLLASQPNRGRLLDLGCGGGRLCVMAAPLFQEVWGVDYAEAAIAVAAQLKMASGRTNLHLKVAAFESEGVQFDELFDVVVVAGTLEHVKDPLQTFNLAHSLLKPNGLFILECPNFSNFRGFVYGTFLTAFGFPMSLADIRQIRCEDIRQWSEESRFQIEGLVGFLFKMGWSDRAVADFAKRVPAALRDMGDSAPKVDLARFEGWLKNQLNSNNRVLSYLQSQEILNQIPVQPAIELLRPDGVEDEMWNLMQAYLDDNFEADPYYCDVAPFNEWGGGSIYLLRKGSE